MKQKEKRIPNKCAGLPYLLWTGLPLEFFYLKESMLVVYCCLFFVVIVIFSFIINLTGTGRRKKINHRTHDSGPCYSKCGCWKSRQDITWGLSVMQRLRPLPNLLIPDPHFNKILRDLYAQFENLSSSDLE